MTPISLPRLLRIGSGAVAEAGRVLSELGLARPLVVTDPFLAGNGSADRLVSILQADGIAPALFTDVVPDPTELSVQAALEQLRRGNHDCVVGFGGGSPIDTAKAVAVLARRGGGMRALRAPHQEDEPGLPVVAIPTTAGTGSEATRFTIITDGDEKLLCVGLAYMPVAALVDYELTLTMPPRLTADTGIDALTHAIEAYVSRRANPFSDGMARLAMGAIAPNLRRVWADPSDCAAREAMMMGSLQAGIAFSNSSVALVHGMSRPIGAFFHVAHGLSNAMLLPIVTEFSLSGAPGRFADCARAMGLTTGEPDVIAGARLVAELKALNTELQVPTPEIYGIAEPTWMGHVDTMAEQALASGSPANNPRQPTHAEIVELYERVWAGAHG